MSLYTRLATALDIASRVMGCISCEIKAMVGLSLAKKKLTCALVPNTGGAASLVGARSLGVSNNLRRVVGDMVSLGSMEHYEPV